MHTAIHTISQHHCFGGRVGYYTHPSQVTGATMRVAVFQPPRALRGRRVPVLIYLAGLTCTEETVMIKGNALRFAAEKNLMLVAPDTSPRGRNLPGEAVDWELGLGAGFYVDAVREPWAPHYRMYSYIAEELPEVVCSNFPARRERMGLFGHSMGGHGALVIGLRNPRTFASLSAFAPIAAPTRSPWGEKAFTAYLGEDREAWRAYDASEVIRDLGPAAGRPPILVDQGMADPFLDIQLHPHLLEDACRDTGQPLTLRRHEGYDHGYFFIATFMEDHIRHHAGQLSSLAEAE